MMLGLVAGCFYTDIGHLHYIAINISSLILPFLLGDYKSQGGFFFFWFFLGGGERMELECILCITSFFNLLPSNELWHFFAFQVASS